MNKEVLKQIIDILNDLNLEVNGATDNLNEDTAQPSNFYDLKKKINKLKKEL